MPKIALTDGWTSYQWDGPDNGPIVLLVHGATVPGWQFERLVPQLARHGLRTLRLDLYGHGKSAIPTGSYTRARFATQVCELLSALEVPHSIGALGHSMGAAVVAEAAVREPQRFSRLVLAAPMLDFVAQTPSARLLLYPAIGELLTHLYMVPMLKRRRRRRYRQIGCDDLTPLFTEQAARPGFGDALLSMFRCGALGDQSDAYRQLGALGINCALVWGAEDGVVTATQLARIAALANAGHQHCFDGLGHNFLITNPAQLAPHLARLLTCREETNRV